jgi:predicted DNA-binding antitoxin AbrB/MazE fold protein
MKVMAMPQAIQAIYENGVFRPLGKVNIPERRTLEILILEDDLPLSLISRVADQGGSYDFLDEAGEDIYTANDGEAV